MGPSLPSQQRQQRRHPRLSVVQMLVREVMNCSMPDGEWVGYWGWLLVIRRGTWQTPRAFSGVLTPPCQWLGPMSTTTTVTALTPATSPLPQLVQGGSSTVLPMTFPFRLLELMMECATAVMAATSTRQCQG